MSFKDGIPLLAPFEDEDEGDEEFTVSTLPHRPKKINKRHVLFCMVLFGALFMVVALVVGVTVPVVLVQQDHQGGEDNGNMVSTGTLSLSSSPIHAKPSSSQPGVTMVPSSGSSVNSSSVSIMTPSTSQPMMVTPITSQPIMLTPRVSESVMLTPRVSESVMLTPSTSQPVMLTPSTSQPVMLTPSVSKSVMVTPSTSQPVMLTPRVSESVMLTPRASESVMLTPRVSESVMLTPRVSESLMVTPTPSLTSVFTTTLIPTPTSTPTPQSPTSFYQSELDKREYKVMTLDNQLRVLLISDPSSNVSAASMDVAAGSFDDPEEWVGLAHFCEHMLFLGTAKYPEEGEYSQYLTQHGGYDNAFTSTENTNFYFKVQADYLQTALDMFAQFFISPLFTNSSVGREVNAVNSEHEKNLLDDNWRRWELLKNLSNPAHPFHKFSTGNLDTLLKPGLLEQLLKYYNSKYSANRMQLVIYGRDNLTVLTDWTLYSFQNITNRNVSATPITTTSYPPPYNQRIIYYYPVADSNTLSIIWQVPSQEKKYQNAVSGFITRYLGHEGTGSVLHLLKSEGLVTALSAGVEFDTESYTLLFVDLDLTWAGLQGVSRVVQVVHWYVGLLRDLDETEFGKRFEEYRMIQQNVFDYSERQAPQDYVVSLAGKMRVVDDPEDFLSSPKRFLPNHALFLSVLDCMYPSNATLFLGTHRLNISPSVANITHVFSQGAELLDQPAGDTPIPWPDQLDMYEDIYKIPYGVQNISAELANFWGSNSSGFQRLMLPQSNKFIITSKLSVLTKPDNDSSDPIEIRKDEGISLYWLLDSRDFPEPRVNLRCDITNPSAEPSPLWEAKTRLFISAVKATLSTVLYGATEVGFTFDLTSRPRGISLSLSGLSDEATVTKVITTTANALLSGDIGELFNSAKQGTIDEFSNYNFTTLPYRYTPRYIQRVLMERPYWKNWQVLDHMNNLTVAEIQSFAHSQLLSNMTLLCLVHGNVEKNSALKFINSLTDAFSERLLKIKVGVVGQYSRDRVQLEPGMSYGVTIPTLNPVDQNSVVNIVFQVGSGCVLSNDSTPKCDKVSLVKSLHLALLEEMISSVCFDVLRTQQQLGYVVFCFSTYNEDTGSFQVLVQSQSYNASDVYERINNFLIDYYNSTILHSLNATWSDEVNVLRSTLEQRDATLDDRTDRFWREVGSGRLQFSYRQQQVAVLNEGRADLNPASFGQFYFDHVLSTNTTRKLLIMVYSPDKEVRLPSDYTPIDYTHLNQSSTTLS